MPKFDPKKTPVVKEAKSFLKSHVRPFRIDLGEEFSELYGTQTHARKITEALSGRNERVKLVVVNALNEIRRNYNIRLQTANEKDSEDSEDKLYNDQPYPFFNTIIDPFCDFIANKAVRDEDCADIVQIFQKTLGASYRDESGYINALSGKQIEAISLLQNFKKKYLAAKEDKKSEVVKTYLENADKFAEINQRQSLDQDEIINEIFKNYPQELIQYKSAVNKKIKSGEAKDITEALQQSFLEELNDIYNLLPENSVLKEIKNGVKDKFKFFAEVRDGKRNPENASKKKGLEENIADYEYLVVEFISQYQQVQAGIHKNERYKEKGPGVCNNALNIFVNDPFLLVRDKTKSKDKETEEKQELEKLKEAEQKAREAIKESEEDSFLTMQQQALKEINYQDAARKIQQTWREHQNKKQKNEQPDQKDKDQENRNLAAIIIQETWRSYLSNKSTEEKRNLENEAATAIQRAWRNHATNSSDDKKVLTDDEKINIATETLAKMAERKQEDTAIKIQRAWRKKTTNIQAQGDDKENLINNSKDKDAAAIKIQKIWRGQQVRKLTNTIKATTEKKGDISDAEESKENDIILEKIKRIEETIASCIKRNAAEDRKEIFSEKFKIKIPQFKKDSKETVAKSDDFSLLQMEKKLDDLRKNYQENKENKENIDKVADIAKEVDVFYGNVPMAIEATEEQRKKTKELLEQAKREIAKLIKKLPHEKVNAIALTLQPEAAIGYDVINKIFAEIGHTYDVDAINECSRRIKKIEKQLADGGNPMPEILTEKGEQKFIEELSTLPIEINLKSFGHGALKGVFRSAFDITKRAVKGGKPNDSEYKEFEEKIEKTIDEKFPFLQGENIFDKLLLAIKDKDNDFVDNILFDKNILGAEASTYKSLDDKEKENIRNKLTEIAEYYDQCQKEIEEKKQEIIKRIKEAREHISDEDNKNQPLRLAALASVGTLFVQQVSMMQGFNDIVGGTINDQLNELLLGKLAAQSLQVMLPPPLNMIFEVDFIADNIETFIDFFRGLIEEVPGLNTISEMLNIWADEDMQAITGVIGDSVLAPGAMSDTMLAGAGAVYLFNNFWERKEAKDKWEKTSDDNIEEWQKEMEAKRKEIYDNITKKSDEFFQKCHEKAMMSKTYEDITGSYLKKAILDNDKDVQKARIELEYAKDSYEIVEIKEAIAAELAKELAKEFLELPEDGSDDTKTNDLIKSFAAKYGIADQAIIDAATKIQREWRDGRREDRESKEDSEYQSKKAAAVKIQSLFRGYLVRREKNNDDSDSKESDDLKDKNPILHALYQRFQNLDNILQKHEENYQKLLASDSQLDEEGVANKLQKEFGSATKAKETRLEELEKNLKEKEKEALEKSSVAEKKAELIAQKFNDHNLDVKKEDFLKEGEFDFNPVLKKLHSLAKEDSEKENVMDILRSMVGDNVEIDNFEKRYKVTDVKLRALMHYKLLNDDPKLNGKSIKEQIEYVLYDAGNDALLKKEDILEEFTKYNKGLIVKGLVDLFTKREDEKISVQDVFTNKDNEGLQDLIKSNLSINDGNARDLADKILAKFSEKQKSGTQTNEGNPNKMFEEIMTEVLMDKIRYEYFGKFILDCKSDDGKSYIGKQEELLKSLRENIKSDNPLYKLLNEGPKNTDDQEKLRKALIDHALEKDEYKAIFEKMQNQFWARQGFEFEKYIGGGERINFVDIFAEADGYMYHNLDDFVKNFVEVRYLTKNIMENGKIIVINNSPESFIDSSSTMQKWLDEKIIAAEKAKDIPKKIRESISEKAKYLINNPEVTKEDPTNVRDALNRAVQEQKKGEARFQNKEAEREKEKLGQKLGMGG